MRWIKPKAADYDVQILKYIEGGEVGYECYSPDLPRIKACYGSGPTQAEALASFQETFEFWVELIGPLLSNPTRGADRKPDCELKKALKE